ncbi:MAG TPA: 2-hydroxyglutaryl-CoA dehydratase [Firmicutes bacterium]|nr:2-hydroxyglutaryl-CoA dehydratase [Bacillota bacterium]
MPVAGIDIGSLSTEVVILKKEEMLAQVIIPTGANSKLAAEKAMKEALEKSGLSFNELGYIVATGYGRVSVPFANKKVTEISCHGKGAFFLHPGVRTVIDIGGQDSKVIRLSPQGKVIDFVMNEKCAAGTGRFLEVMAHALETDLEEMSRPSAPSVKTANISSMCTVFAESEVVSLVAEGHPREEIIKGIIYSVVERTISLARRVGVEEELMMTGGVAKNIALREALEKSLGIKITVPDEPQAVGALGAALLAAEEAVK